MFTCTISNKVIKWAPRISSYFISYKLHYLYILIMVHPPVSNITGPPNWLQMFSIKWGLYYMVEDIFSGVSKTSFDCHLELLHYNYNNDINTHVTHEQWSDIQRYPQLRFVTATFKMLGCNPKKNFASRNWIFKARNTILHSIATQWNYLGLNGGAGKTTRYSCPSSKSPKHQGPHTLNLSNASNGLSWSM